MMMGLSKGKIVLAFVFCFSGLLNAFAQPSLKTAVDKDAILIGEQIKLKVVATLPPQDFFVKWIEIPDSLQHFEVVEKSKIDSFFTNQKLIRLSQTITFTSFDSGKWTLPPFNIDFNPVNGDNGYNLFTDSFPVTVSYMADTTNELRDIKPIRELKEGKPVWYWVAIAAAALVLIVLIILLYNYFAKRRKQVPARPALSPYQQAIRELQKLKELNLSGTGQLKIYHAGLTTILKQYLAAGNGPHLISSTTGEVLILLNQKGLDKTKLAKTAEAMRCSDAVKFAKYIPSTEENEECWAVVKYAVDFTEQLNNKTEPGVG